MAGTLWILNTCGKLLHSQLLIKASVAVPWETFSMQGQVNILEARGCPGCWPILCMAVLFSVVTSD